MPPKKSTEKVSKKTEQKKKDKVVEDKTFGLKNKKGSKQQKFIQHVTKQVQFGNQKTSKLGELDKKPSEKDEKKKKAEELNMLFKPVEQKIGKGVDPKSVVCSFFKLGQCTKGNKCKFSHDLNVSRKSEKKNVYSDERDEEDDMTNWDEEKLEAVIKQKHGESNSEKPKTAIICKFFIEAVENSKYGWFWNCPNGNDKCIYKHALPPGFVLKKDKQKEDEKNLLTLEDLVETERAALSSKNLTKVTLESFMKWKELKKQEKINKIKELKDKKKSDFKAGKALGLSGKDLFEFNPDLVIADDEGADDTVYDNDNADVDDENIKMEKIREIDLNAFEATEVDDTGTKASNNRLGEFMHIHESKLQVNNDTNHQFSEAIGGEDLNCNFENQEDNIPIDENLFADENLQDLEDDLDLLDLEKS